MSKITYVTGGARSGKSSFSEKKVREYSDCNWIYIATGIPFDNEMEDRIKKHQEQRGSNWTTVEGFSILIPEISKVLSKEKKNVILLDCLTNMVTNLMFYHEKEWEGIGMDRINEIEEQIKKEVLETISFIKNSGSSLIIVSNEVGMGLVPPYPLGRYFRDISGRINQLAAEFSDEAYLVISGIELKLK